ncbi:MAG TPA: RcnB family protein [Xanthomonadaceae bacterium]|nr:RcnB family protein [Xanthomonadaceae bacterium]
MLKPILVTLLSIGLGAPMLAQAAPGGYDGRYGYQSHYRDDDGWRYDRGERYRDRYDRHDRSRYRHDDRRYDRRYDRGWDRRHYVAKHRYRAPHRYVRPRGYYSHSWRPGYYLPSGYYSHTYYVDHYNYGLQPPPYGYRWVRVDNDVVLVALASGLIANVMYDIFR